MTITRQTILLVALCTIALLSALVRLSERRCAWCNRGWAWRRQKSGIRAFPICRRCHRAPPAERIRTVRSERSHLRLRS